MSDDELSLIQLARQGDAAACSTLYDRHYDAVFRYCYYRVGDVPLAQDLTAEVFVRMVENLETFDVRGRPLLAWLYAIARNLIADVYRKSGQEPQLSLNEAQLVGDDTLTQRVEQRLLAEDLAAALARLTEGQRQVILLKFVMNHDNAEVARMLGKPQGAIKSLQHRALAALRRALEQGRDHEA